MSLKICLKNLCFFHVATLMRNEVFHHPFLRRSGEGRKETFDGKKIEMKFHRVTKLCRFTPGSTRSAWIFHLKFFPRFLPFTTLSISIKESVCQLNWENQSPIALKFEIQLFNLLPCTFSERKLCWLLVRVRLWNGKIPKTLNSPNKAEWMGETRIIFLKEFRICVSVRKLWGNSDRIPSKFDSYKMPITLYFIRLLAIGKYFPRLFSPSLPAAYPFHSHSLHRPTIFSVFIQFIT